jgi:hypothetical protein
MATAITLLSATKNSSTLNEGNGIATRVPHDKFLIQQNAIMFKSEPLSHFKSTKPSNLQVNPILINDRRSENGTGSGYLDLVPISSDDCLSYHGKHLTGSDSRRGIKHSYADSLDAGQTGYKIPFDADCESKHGWNIVQILRENWNKGNISQISEHHKNSHNPNPIEKASQNIIIDPTMTARILPKEHLPSRRMDINNTMSRGHCSTRSRIRSRSIAIKRPTNDEKLEEIRQNSLAAEYDWATWRMYNRIIDHRQKHPLTYQYDESAESLDASSSSLQKEGWDSFSRPITSYDGNLTTVSLEGDEVQQYNPEYGEVFELDL